MTAVPESAASRSAPDLSVVIAAWPDTRGVADFLAALAPQLDDRTEVLVVGPGEWAAPAAGGRVRSLSGVPGLIPKLWGVGIGEARGRVVAITTTHFRPAAGWATGIRAAHERLPSPAIGGPIDPPRGRGAVAWATYFLRYSAYLGLDREAAVPDLAGDNASYKRAAVVAHPETLRDGFWEQDFHRHFLAAGERLTFVPNVRLTQCRSFGFFGFLAQRFAHGRQFGATRWAARPWAVRAAAATATPLVPAVLLGKIVRRVVGSRRDYGPFVAALPVMLCFLAAWSLGEGVGAVRPPPPTRLKGNTP